jgi:Fe-S-cluster containining protein
MILCLEMIDGQRHQFREKVDTVPCFRCGSCCTNFLVKLASIDIRVLSKRFGISNRNFIHQYAKKTPIGPVLRQIGNRCIFLSYDRDNTRSNCDVYTHRPEVCRNYLPSLYRDECLEGLKKMGKDRRILTPHDIYTSEEEIATLYSVFENKIDSLEECDYSFK